MILTDERVDIIGRLRVIVVHGGHGYFFDEPAPEPGIGQRVSQRFLRHIDEFGRHGPQQILHVCEGEAGILKRVDTATAKAEIFFSIISNSTHRRVNTNYLAIVGGMMAGSVQFAEPF